MIEDHPPPAHADWKPLSAEMPPRPTTFPCGLALAVTLIFWGLITTWMITFAGLGLFAVSLAGWIRDIRLERAKHGKA